MKSFKLTTLIEDTISASKMATGLKTQHGLSIVIEKAKPKISILMDTGSSPDVLRHNARILGFNFDKLDVVFLSHGHYDHAGGLTEVLKGANKKVVVIAHPDALKPKFAARPRLRYIGLPFECPEIRCHARLLLVRNSVKITENIITTGEIERLTPYEVPLDFWTVEGDTLIEDSMKDDQGLVLNLEDKGLVILSGCAHAGIINTIKHAQKLVGVDRVHAVIGGFHLKDSSGRAIKMTINELAEIGPEIIYPCHCTGQKAIRQLRFAFGKKCKVLRTGDVIEI